MHFLTHRNSSAFGFTVTPDAHKMLQSRILALAQLAESLTERFYSRNIIRLNRYLGAHMHKITAENANIHSPLNIFFIP